MFDTYERDTVVTLLFGHAPAAPEGGPFAELSLVVTDMSKNEVSGYEVSVSNRMFGFDDDDDHDHDTSDLPNVRIKAKPVTVRKSAVVGKRTHGRIADATVTSSSVDEYDETGEDA